MKNILQYRYVLSLLFALIGFTNFAYAQGNVTVK